MRVVGPAEAVPDDGADAAEGNGGGGGGGAEGSGAAGAEGAGEGGAVEAEELVAVGGATGVLLVGRVVAEAARCSGRGVEVEERAGFDGVTVVLEAAEDALGVVDLEDALDLADRMVLLLPAGLEDYLHDVSSGILRPQLRHSMANDLMEPQVLGLGKHFAALGTRTQRPRPRVRPGGGLGGDGVALVAPGELPQLHSPFGVGPGAHYRRRRVAVSSGAGEGDGVDCPAVGGVAVIGVGTVDDACVAVDHVPEGADGRAAGRPSPELAAGGRVVNLGKCGGDPAAQQALELLPRGRGRGPGGMRWWCWWWDLRGLLLSLAVAVVGLVADVLSFGSGGGEEGGESHQEESK